MFLWKFQLIGNFTYKSYWYCSCKVSKWKAYQYISKEYPNCKIVFLGKMNNKGSNYVLKRSQELNNIYKEIIELKHQADYYRKQGWKETPDFKLHYKYFTSYYYKLSNLLYNYPRILTNYNNWQLKTQNLLEK